MKTFIADIIPRIQKYSQKLDNLTLLTNQHWVVVDEIANSKTVYIFRPTNELLISKNGKVEKAKWEYLGNNTLLIDLKNDESYLFRHGFFDENILALKIDGKEEYEFLVNETRFDKELNSADRILEFLQQEYIDPSIRAKIIDVPTKRLDENPCLIKISEQTKVIATYKTKQGQVDVEIDKNSNYPWDGDKVILNGKFPPDGKYRIGFMWYLIVKNGFVEKVKLLSF